MPSMSREEIALQQVYAALLVAHHGTTEPFSSLVRRAYGEGMLTPASHALLARASMRVAMTRTGASGSLDGETGVSSAALSSLAARILGSMSLADLPWLAAPVVLNPWTTLSQAFEAMLEGDGPCAVRGDDGYCMPLSHSSVAAWMMRVMGTGREGDSSDEGPVDWHGLDTVDAMQVAVAGPDDWTTVDATITVSEVQRTLRGSAPRISTVLVYRNEDYSGDPIGIVTPALLARWQRELERYRRRAAELLEEASDDDLHLPVDDETPARRIAGELVHAPLSAETLDRAILMSIALSGRGLAPRELTAFLAGRHTAGLASRHLVEAPLFGCVPGASSHLLMVRLAGLVHRGLLRISPCSSSYLLGPRTVRAVLQDSATSGFAALDGLLDGEAASHGR